MTILPALPALLFYPILLIAAGLGDLKTMKIPNQLVLLLLLGYLLLAPASGLSLLSIAQSSAAAAAVFVAAFGAFACRWMGGGDVKLMAVAALWLGAPFVPAFVFYTTLMGALLTAIVLIFRTIPLPLTWREYEWLLRLHSRETGIPYGVAIAAAGIFVFFQTPWVAHLH